MKNEKSKFLVPQCLSALAPSQKSAFTLAEVLITLAIIGVVAAMTIPTLITDTQNKQFSVGLKKRYAELMQVFVLSVAENGNMNAWDWTADDSVFISKYIAPYLKISSCENCWRTASLNKGFWFEQPAVAAVEKPTLDVNPTDPDSSDSDEDSDIAPADEPEITYTLPDGSQLGFYKQNAKTALFIYVDLNGKTNPNKFGIDKYVILAFDDKVTFWGEDESDLTAGDYGCSTNGNGMYCGALLKRNQWEFDENYPNL